jgi:hypothetical protein
LKPYARERIENWVSDFTGGDAARRLPAAVRESADAILAEFLVRACEARGVEPEEVEEADCRRSLLERVAGLELSEEARGGVPELCGAFLEDLEERGRLAGGRRKGAFVRALAHAWASASSGKVETFRRPSAKVGRNDPCPCGSGKKFKKCCMDLASGAG